MSELWFNIPPKHTRSYKQKELRLKASSNKPEEQGVKPATPELFVKRVINCINAAPGVSNEEDIVLCHKNNTGTEANMFLEKLTSIQKLGELLHTLNIPLSQHMQAD